MFLLHIRYALLGCSWLLDGEPELRCIQLSQIGCRAAYLRSSGQINVSKTDASSVAFFGLSMGTP